MMVSGDANFGEGRERRSGSRSETEGSGGASPKLASASVGGLAPAGATPDPEVTDKPKRRRFTVEYKLSLLKKADACTQPGEVGALLRREGVYSSTLSQWRRQREEGTLASLKPKRRGRKVHEVNPLAGRVTELEREVQRLQGKLRQAETIIDVQKKLCEMVEMPVNRLEKRSGE